jgi:hypothetical protein
MSLPEEVASLLDAPAAGLARAMTTGHPLESGDLAGHAYLGISLGLPAWVDRALWKTFVKAFAPAQDGGSRGWNVKMAQVGLDGPHAPLLARDGRPRSFGHFRVGPCPAGRVDGLGPEHVLLDYAVSPNPLLDPSRAIRDPLVSLRPGSAEVLLGRTYTSILGGWLGTPSYFALVRDGRLSHLTDPQVLLPVG